MENQTLIDTKENNALHEDLDTVDYDCKDNNAKQLQKEAAASTCYRITPDIQFMEDPIFYFKKEGKIIYTAYLKENVIHIGEGSITVNNKNGFNDIAKITRMKDDYNVVNIGDQEIDIRYALYYPSSDYSIKISFDHNGKKLSWKPKTPKTAKSFNGKFNHRPIKSDKNIILQNHSKNPTFIFRSMKDNVYEAECNPEINPVIVFAIALSEIVGPLSYESKFSFF